MRTKKFIQVFNDIVSMMGRDPTADMPPDMARAIASRINDRVRMICLMWPWPQWTLTEERAFRQIWNANHQYLRQSLTDGKPDEVFYIPNTSYYTVNPSATADPPIGTAPTDPALQQFFTPLDPVETYIAYDQTCRRAIGTALAVYSRNPVFAAGRLGKLHFMPSEKGIDILHAGTPTVFLSYKMPVPEYSIIPYVVGRVYNQGDVVLDPTVGECFQALTSTVSVPSDTQAWRRVPFPVEWNNYVVTATFGDCLMESDQNGNQDIQSRMVLSQDAHSGADEFLQSEIDSLASQGQVLRWKFFDTHRHHHHWRESQDWGGGVVSTLSDACEDELGWVYPTPTVEPMVSWKFYNNINSVDSLVDSLIQIQTRFLLPGSIAEFVTGSPGSRVPQKWQLLEGPSPDPSDPGQKIALDYDSGTNNKHWEKLG